MHSTVIAVHSVSRRSSLVSVLIVIFVAVIARGVVIGFAGDSLQQDPDSYRVLAETWAETGTFGFLDEGTEEPRPTAFRPPLYPWLLSWFVGADGLSLTGVAVVHWLLGVGTVVLVFLVARELDLVAWAVALAVTIDPLLLRASQLVMTETLAAFLAMLVWWLWIRVQSVEEERGDKGGSATGLVTSSTTLLIGAGALGLVLGLALLARPTAAPWCVLLIGAWLIATARNSLLSIRMKLMGPALATLLVAVCVLSWTWRNQSQLGKPIWATTHGGYTLLLANNPMLYEHFRENGASRDWDAEPFHRRWVQRAEAEQDSTRLDYWRTEDQPSTDSQSTGFPQSVGFAELKDDEVAYAAARATISSEPWLFCKSCIYRALWFWALWPREAGNVEKLLIGGWYSVWFLLIAVSLCHQVWSWWSGGKKSSEGKLNSIWMHLRL
ncbi:MAG: hypothetical protein AAF394_06810, partial [Planctomycetota bacterium]